VSYEDLKKEDKIALAETYRVFELLNGPSKERIPREFVEILLDYGDLNAVPPFDAEKSLKDFNLSKRGKYLIMYMCTL